MNNSQEKLYNVIIIGSGPAGLTAGIYAARAELEPLLLAGRSFGGQLMLTTDVGNFPGFPKDIAGPKLVEQMMEQAKRFGTKIIFEDVARVDFTSRPFQILTPEAKYLAKAVIIATGASARWLGLPSERRLRGKGVSACATCDGFFFKDKKVAVVGGGDAAMEEAIYLTKFATEVFVIHRRDSLRATKIMQHRAFDNPKIKFIWDSVIGEVLGQDKVEGLKIKNVETGEEKTLAIDGLFVTIGHEPNTKFLVGSGLELDEKGYIVTYERSRTGIEGVFAAGDVHDYIYRQAITAAAAGCRAAMDVEKWLLEQQS